ncbi:MAG: efflux RND transporter periplasmic adaptor subunit, partial [Maritimibacter sp.]|nr:efflux RND transporter periplasmic adaptor subunit [Maritimibacter sp.]
AAQTRVLQARAALATAQAAVSAAEAGAASAEAAVESARAAVAATERDIANTEVTAPFDGLLETDTAELGSLMTAGSLCATIIDLDPIKLVGYVAEVDVDRVQVGAPVGARLASGREVLGRVTFLSRSADPQTRTFRVEAELANPDLAIRDGQTGEIAIQSAGRSAHLLPQSALTLDDAGTLGVRVAEDGAEGDVARFLPVEMLRDSPDGVWVAGLPEVARVITTGQDYVTDGTPLAVTLAEPGA